MKKGVLAAIIAVVAVFGFGGWYYISPVLAMNELKTAAQAGDTEALKARVNFPSIRESLKSQFKAYMLTKVAKEKQQNPYAGIGILLANAIIDPLIDSAVSPKGIKAMVENGHLKKADTSDAPTDQDDGNNVKWTIQHRGMSTFIARPTDKDSSKGPTLVFKRDGLGWDLVDIEVPLDAGDVATNGQPS